MKANSCRKKTFNPGKAFVFHLLLMTLLIGFTAVVPVWAQAQSEPTPLISINAGNASDQPEQLSVVLQIFVLMTVLSLAPAILVMLTSFTRIAIVLSVLRRAMGTQSMPPNQIVLGLSLFLTLFIMSPVWNTVNEEALQPYLQKKISQEQAFEKAMAPIRAFMVRHTREKDMALLIDIAKSQRPRTVADVPTTVLIPAFILSELKTAFQMAFMLYVPFLVIDMVVASVLLSMGMMMLPPIMISLPFKLMLFVLADGWHLIVGSLVKSFA